MHTYKDFTHTHACTQYSCMCGFLHTHVHASGLCFLSVFFLVFMYIRHLEVRFRLGGTGGVPRMGGKEVRSAVVRVVVQQGCFRRCFSRPAALQTCTCIQRHPHNGCERHSQAHTYNIHVQTESDGQTHSPQHDNYETLSSPSVHGLCFAYRSIVKIVPDF